MNNGGNEKLTTPETTNSPTRPTTTMAGIKRSPNGAPANSANNSAGQKKLCAVCGDRALGYNFNALTCESCKAFFRRNALKTKEFKCPFSNECEVNTVTRRFCQKCRLKKCFDIGMKKEWILSDEEKQQKRQKIEENRARKRHAPSEIASATPLVINSATNSPSISPAPSTSIQITNEQSDEVPIALVNDSDLTSAAAVLLDLQPATPSISMPVNPGTAPSIGGERPKARVLPSTRHVGPNMVKVEIKTENAKDTSATSNASLIKNELLVSPPSTPMPIQSSGQSAEISNNTLSTNQLNSNSVPFNDIFGNTPFLSAISNPNPRNSVSLGDSSRIVASTPVATSAIASTSIAKPAAATRLCGQIPVANSVPTEIPDFSQSHNLDDIIAVAIEAEFHEKNLPVPANSGKELSDQEKARLQELFVASRALVEPLDLEKTSLDEDPSNLISVINLTDLAIKRIIRMAKKITPFINMCQEDQIALLKGGCTELMILRSVINYNPDKNSWQLPSKDRPREVSMELLKEASQLGVNLYEEHQRFVQSFDAQWRTDENVMLLLSAIALFTPNRANVLHNDVVKLEQDTYYYLLRRYLETVCSGCEPRRAYLHLIGRLQDLHRLNDSHIQLFLEVNPKLVEPLLIEIFDLNPR